jgi:hypothetical protein
MANIKGSYPNSEQGNFQVVDTIAVPHPYCITPKHLKHCDSMYLNAETIERAESKGAVCDICRKLVKSGRQDYVLSYAEHEQALLVECKMDIKPTPPELHQWLLSIKEEATANGYAGFAFKKSE